LWFKEYKKIKDGVFLEAFVEQPLSMTGQGKYMLCQDGNIYYLGVLSRGILALKAIKGHSCPGSVKGHCGFKVVQVHFGPRGNH
jgi:hypothetical protein